MKIQDFQNSIRFDRVRANSLLVVMTDEASARLVPSNLSRCQGLSFIVDSVVVIN